MVGDQLFILNDNKTLPNGHLLSIPLKENWIDIGGVWKKGGCFPAMGMETLKNIFKIDVYLRACYRCLFIYI